MNCRRLGGGTRSRPAHILTRRKLEPSGDSGSVDDRTVRTTEDESTKLIQARRLRLYRHVRPLLGTAGMAVILPRLWRLGRKLREVEGDAAAFLELLEFGTSLGHSQSIARGMGSLLGC
jgi:hypothetical protein